MREDQSLFLKIQIIIFLKIKNKLMLLYVFLYYALDIPMRVGMYYNLCVTDEKTDTEKCLGLSHTGIRLDFHFKLFFQVNHK